MISLESKTSTYLPLQPIPISQKNASFYPVRESDTKSVDLSPFTFFIYPAQKTQVHTPKWSFATRSVGS